MKDSNPTMGLANLDKTVAEPRRFAILVALERMDILDYICLRNTPGLSQGNLATRLRLAKLEGAGLIEIRKRIILRRPNSRVYITDAGRDALAHHRRRLRELLEEARRWQPEEDEEYRHLWRAGEHDASHPTHTGSQEATNLAKPRLYDAP